jgi:hypothetical protein
MEAFPVLRLKKITRKNGLLVALRHNKREFNLELKKGNIDPSKTHQNYSLTENESALMLDKNAKIMLRTAGISKIRKNAVMAVEVLFSLPIHFAERDNRNYFIDCYEWVKKTLGGEIISFDIHNDEAAPHAHALILPLINGKLNGSDLVGGRANLYRIRNLFYRDVANHYGLAKRKKSILTSDAKDKVIRLILISLKDDPVNQSLVWPVIRGHIDDNPKVYADFLNIDVPKKTSTRSIADFFISKGRGKFN